MCSTDIFLGLLAVLFPPLPVWVKRGLCSADSLLNILLLILGYIPGLLHSWYIIAKYPDAPYEHDYQRVPQDAENGRIYVFVHHGSHGGGAQGDGQGQGHGQPKPQGNMNYGTANSNNHHHGATSSGPSALNKQQQDQQHHHHQPQEQGTTPAAGPSDGDAPPPSYAQVVAGDHKVQTHD